MIGQKKTEDEDILVRGCFMFQPNNGQLRVVGLLSEDERLREGFVLLLESMRRQWASGNSSRIGKKSATVEGLIWEGTNVRKYIDLVE